MADTLKASVITDHAFEPRTQPTIVTRTFADGSRMAQNRIPGNPYLCQQCNLGEAAHRETTVKR